MGCSPLVVVMSSRVFSCKFEVVIELKSTELLGASVDMSGQLLGIVPFSVKIEDKWMIINDLWRAWRLPGWKTKGRDISWAEAVGFELLVSSVLATSQPGQFFRYFGNNWGVSVKE
jgi:hypothetical protein